MSVTIGTTDRGPTLDESWTSRAACAGGAGRTGVGAGADPDAMFVQGAAQRDARLVCFACPVRMECLLEAFETGMEFGVWGGLTERERRARVRQAAGSGVPWRQRLLYDSELRARFEQERLRAAEPVEARGARRRAGL
ncbi:WhiB family transcriptional regulator [Salana multivorans]